MQKKYRNNKPKTHQIGYLTSTEQEQSSKNEEGSNNSL